ncbi:MULTISPECIES: glycosyltransferase [Asticcacaulis]|uniref:glycosyltransferase n=1 Tax=Asticcacaulis TaxID=76890 RepID=UPI001AE58C58|nr:MULTISPECIES: glycosyltransferase [Asticcacaulis]MBP2161880.1 glycosyltransferase involved in cell wall biosynthesis [Asticcacaulis solisilvae]MDR6802927.1 glycosyltransferase involved in cell wall biosynthesis [Asticcacaulis sp. BE141]
MIINDAATKRKIVFLSDLAVGYGTPQITYLLQSLADYYSTDDICVIEPDQKGRKWAGDRFPFKILRVSTVYPAYSFAFISEYNKFILDFLNKTKPDIVVASHGFVLPACLKYKSNNNILIYYKLESVSHQVKGLGSAAINLNRCVLSEADVVLVPERLRASADLNMYGWKRKDLVEVYNAGQTYSGHSPNVRNGRILYAGTIGPQTLCEIMLSDELKHIGFDIAGSAETDNARAFLEQASRRENIRYLGFLSSDQLDSIRRRYAFSLVMWRPDDVNQLYASPNKFFETVAAGVPPIAAPHPQCYEIIQKYNCGLLAEDWNEASLVEAIKSAAEVFYQNPVEYSELVENCQTAADDELNWDAQFNKITPLLDAAALHLRSRN